MRRLSRLAVAVVLVLALPAFAQEAASPSLGSKALELLTPANIGAVAGMIFSALGALAFLTARRKKIVALASYYAFHIVEDIGAELDGEDGFDKTARYLKELDAYMVANGWRPLKPGEQELAKMQASALHGLEVAKTKIAVAAAEAAAGPRAP